MQQCRICGLAFRGSRQDARFCSPACRQKAYRQRAATGEKSKPAEDHEERVIYLDEIAGVLHYHGTAIIAITELYRGWSGFGNRHVSRFPLKGVWALNPILRAEEVKDCRGANHIFECLECRRWSVGSALVFCSRKCRLAHRADQARERRLTAAQ